jgi:Ser/Thr protein kinase RdoA (MazF antagonist)
LDIQTEWFIASQFLAEGTVVAVQPLGDGLINDTLLVTTDCAAVPRFVLQRINREVFRYPERIMANLERLNRHCGTGQDPFRKTSGNFELRLPSLIPCVDGKNCFIGESGDYWRALTYIENSHPLDRLESPDDAERIGFTLGSFHRRVSDLDPQSMADSLPGFHIAPLYFSQYEAARAGAPPQIPAGSPADLRYCENFIDARRGMVPVLENAKREGRLQEQVIHGDPKLNNFLFAAEGRKVMGLIDLDTVKSGLIHYDIADCLRSCCDRAGESDRSASAAFDAGLCEAILKGYFNAAGSNLSDAAIDLLYEAIRLLPFELGLRFLSDYLEGNRYFKVENPEQNLFRAMDQFKLVRSVEEQENSLRQLVRAILRGVEN